MQQDNDVVIKGWLYKELFLCAIMPYLAAYSLLFVWFG